MSEATQTSVKFLFVPVFIPVFIPVPMATLNSPLGEKQQRVQHQQHGTIQPDNGLPLACTHLSGEQEQSFELATPTSPNPKLCFGHYQSGLELEELREPSLSGVKEHCVKQGFKKHLATSPIVVPTSSLDTLPFVSGQQHFFSKEQQVDPCEPLLLLHGQRRHLTRTPSPSHCISSSSILPLLSNGSSFRTSVTQQRRERRAEKLERKRIRKKQNLDYRLSLLNLDGNVFLADNDSVGTYHDPTTPNSKADGVVVSTVDSSSSIVVATITTNNTTTTTTTTVTSTTSVVTSSPLSTPPEVAAFFEAKKSYYLRQDFHLYGNLRNKFLFEKYISSDEGGILVDTFEAMVDKSFMRLSAGSEKMLNTPNAGGNSVWSEVMSYEILNSVYGAQLRRTEMEIEYWPASKITDYSATIMGRHIGVSVTRAINFLDLMRTYKAELTRESTRSLLEKKLFGVLASSASAVDKWEKQILHVWTTSREAAELVVTEYPNVDRSLRANTVVLVTLAKNADWIF